MAKAEKTDGILETVKTIVYALLIAGIFRTLFFQPFWIPSGSMKDTLLVGDFLFVNKMAYGYSEHSCPFSMCKFIDGRWLGSEPDRGDVVVFRHPVTGSDFIKRLIGLPGDTVQVQQGVVYINGEAAPQEPAGEFVETYEKQGPLGNLPQCSNAGVALGSDCVKQRYSETLPGGVTHDILDIREASLDTTPVYTVPEGHYFFMGDNRDNSTDSRVSPSAMGVGFVPYENLIGRADRVIFSSAGRSMLFFWTWRADRFFEEII
ncbi:signal peptidase I [Palleronia pelagia]|uniref:Signal peptidase I n=1 Tax=Palleronia pelagia TaxID=387096 RepID=A0A1H8CQ16_9RHOB|nr:signal peptidase I [Palleronia pelagia]SEM97066.1 signal peptidase I . Serine peptidase. MEROPS family S26A [Palleronia pelagia]